MALYGTNMRRPQLPALTPDTKAFWTGGADGTLKIYRCESCGFHIHPPAPVCSECRSFEVGPVPVSGKGTVATFSVNYQQWLPDQEVPFVLAMVELDEQPGLHVMTNVIGTPPDDVHIGMRVEVVFEQHEEIFLPLFRKADET